MSRDIEIKCGATRLFRISQWLGRAHPLCRTILRLFTFHLNVIGLPVLWCESLPSRALGGLEGAVNVGFSTSIASLLAQQGRPLSQRARLDDIWGRNKRSSRSAWMAERHHFPPGGLSFSVVGEWWAEPSKSMNHSESLKVRRNTENEWWVWVQRFYICLNWLFGMQIQEWRGSQLVPSSCCSVIGVFVLFRPSLFKSLFG